MPESFSTVREYLASLPDDRRKALEAIRKVIRKHMDPAFKEGIQYGMLGYFLPHTKYPAGYHCNPDQPLPFVSVASQKNHIGLYLFCIYCSEEDKDQFIEEWKASGKRLDMGKSCVRVKKLEDVPLEVLGKAIERMTAERFVAAYEGGLSGGSSEKRASKKKASKKKAAKKKASKKKSASKKAGKKKTARKR